MTVRREGDRLIFEVTATEVAELDGAIRDAVIRHVASDIINNWVAEESERRCDQIGAH